MIYKSLIGSSVLMLSVAAPVVAEAADLPDVAPDYVAPAPDNFDWSGFYAGAHAGYLAMWANGEYEAEGIADSGPVDGVILGGQIGYNIQSGDFVYGIEADAAYSFATGSVVNNDSEGASTDLDFLGTVRGRAGRAYGRTFVFATAGVAAGHVDVTFEGQNDDGWSAGVIGGVGLEHAFADNWTVRGEADYLYFFNQDYNNAEGTDVNYNGPRFTLGVNYHF